MEMTQFVSLWWDACNIIWQLGHIQYKNIYYVKVTAHKVYIYIYIKYMYVKMVLKPKRKLKENYWRPQILSNRSYVLKMNLLAWFLHEAHWLNFEGVFFYMVLTFTVLGCLTNGLTHSAHSEKKGWGKGQIEGTIWQCKIHNKGTVELGKEQNKGGIWGDRRATLPSARTSPTLKDRVEKMDRATRAMEKETWVSFNA